MRVLLTSDLHYTLPQLDWVASVAGDYDLVVLAGDHLDVGSVQLRQRRGGHHLFGAADPESAVHQVQHAVHQGQYRVDLVRDEQDRGARGPPSPST